MADPKHPPHADPFDYFQTREGIAALQPDPAPLPLSTMIPPAPAPMAQLLATPAPQEVKQKQRKPATKKKGAKKRKYASSGDESESDDSYRDSGDESGSSDCESDGMESDDDDDARPHPSFGIKGPNKIAHPNWDKKKKSHMIQSLIASSTASETDDKGKKKTASIPKKYRNLDPAEAQERMAADKQKALARRKARDAEKKREKAKEDVVTEEDRKTAVAPVQEKEDKSPPAKKQKTRVSNAFIDDFHERQKAELFNMATRPDLRSDFTLTPSISVMEAFSNNFEGFNPQTKRLVCHAILACHTNNDLQKKFIELFQ